MIKTVFDLNLSQENIKNFFVDSFGKFIAITSQNNLVGNDFQIDLGEEFYFPIVRIINENTILIIDDNAKLKLNAFLLNYEGAIIEKFYVGIGIEDVVIIKNKIIISYFDEGILGKVGPNNDGVSVFDLHGNQKYGYISASANHNFMDCYAIAKFGNNVVFYGYDDFKLRVLDLNFYKITEYETPIEFTGSKAMSTKNENIIFHSSYKDKTSFFIWNPKSKNIQIIESNEKNLNGTNDGTFYNFSKKSFTIIKPLE